MKLYIFRLFIILISSTVMFSCGGDEDELEANEIEDALGLDIQLEWTTGGSASQATSDADLELFLRDADGEIVDDSQGFSFEEVELLDIYSDQTYTVDVEYFRGSVAVDFTIFVIGKDSERTLTYTQDFNSNDEKAVFEGILQIRKSGETYTVLN